MEQVEFLNVLSRALGHGHTLGAAHAARLRSLDALQAAWQAAGIEANDLNPQSPRGMTGWQATAEQLSGRIGRLWHRTGTGRLQITAWRGGSVSLTFAAGGPEPAVALEIWWDPGHKWSTQSYKNVWADRPDRLHLIRDILAGLEWAGLEEEAAKLRALLRDELTALDAWETAERRRWQEEEASHLARFSALVAEHPHHANGEQVYSCLLCRDELATEHMAGEHAGREEDLRGLCDACRDAYWYPCEEAVVSPAASKPTAEAIAARDAADFMEPAC